MRLLLGWQSKSQLNDFQHHLAAKRMLSVWRLFHYLILDELAVSSIDLRVDAHLCKLRETPAARFFIRHDRCFILCTNVLRLPVDVERMNHHQQNCININNKEGGYYTYVMPM